MTGKQSQASITLWDSNEIPKNQEGLIYNWDGYEEKDSVFSLLRYIDTHGDRLRSRYLAWVHDLGEHQISGKRVIDHLAFEDGFSYWWMTRFVEQSPWQSPLIPEVIRFFALEEILLKEKPAKFRFVSSNRRMNSVLQELCVALGIVYEWEKLPKNPPWQFNSKSVLALFPHPLQALVGLIRHICVRWSFRKANRSNWHTGEKAIFICSYFANFDSKFASEGHFHSHYWNGLHDLMRDLELSENWLQNYYPHENVPNPKTANNLVNRFNKNKKKIHTFLDAYLDWSIVFGILKRWLKLLKTASQLKDVEKFSKNVGSQFCSLWPLMKEDWDASLRGVVCIRNLIWFELFNKALAKIPYQNSGLYLFEGLPWERAFIHAWRKHGHGRLIAVAHSTTRFWDLRLFTDHRTINATNTCPVPQADLTAVNGKAAFETYRNLGYPEESIEEIEALRYGSLLKIKNIERENTKKENLRVLVLGDSLSHYTKQILELLVAAQKTKTFPVTYSIKPHPIYPVQSSDYPSLNLKIETKPLEDILCDFDIVCSANLTSASVNAYLSGLKIIVVLCPTDLNFSPLRGYPGVSFVGAPVEIAEAFQAAPSEKITKPDRRSEFFFLDPEFPRWRSLLSSVSST